MSEALETAFTGFLTSLTTLAGAVLPIGVGALLLWVGFRLACKVTNRGVGK